MLLILNILGVNKKLTISCGQMFVYFRNFVFKLFLILNIIVIHSCSTIDSAIDSVSEAGDYIYDSVVFWKDDQPDQEQAIIIEEAMEVPDFAIPQPPDSIRNQGSPNMVFEPNLNNPNFNPPLLLGDPVYRSARQYYFVTPNGSPMPAPPPPPFPQYSIQGNQESYSYGAYFDYMNRRNMVPMGRMGESPMPDQLDQTNTIDSEAAAEIYGIENNCIRVTKDFMTGGFQCDDYD